jgi:hypothetical protein
MRWPGTLKIFEQFGIRIQEGIVVFPSKSYSYVIKMTVMVFFVPMALYSLLSPLFSLGEIVIFLKGRHFKTEFSLSRGRTYFSFPGRILSKVSKYSCSLVTSLAFL